MQNDNQLTDELLMSMGYSKQDLQNIRAIQNAKNWNNKPKQEPKKIQISIKQNYKSYFIPEEQQFPSELLDQKFIQQQQKLYLMHSKSENNKPKIQFEENFEYLQFQPKLYKHQSLNQRLQSHKINEIKNNEQQLEYKKAKRLKDDDQQKSLLLARQLSADNYEDQDDQPDFKHQNIFNLLQFLRPPSKKAPNPISKELLLIQKQKQRNHTQNYLFNNFRNNSITNGSHQVQITNSYLVIKNTFHKIDIDRQAQFLIKFVKNKDLCKSIQFFTAPNHKIQIKITQITCLIVEENQNKIYLMFQQPPKYFQGWAYGRRQNMKVFWQRDFNDFADSQQMKNDIILLSLLHKKYTYQIKPKKFRQFLLQIKNILTKINKPIIQVNNIKQIYKLDSVRLFYQKYNKQKFEQNFVMYTIKDHTKSMQIQFTIISLLFICYSIDIEDIFKLAEYLAKIYESKIVDYVWKVALTLSPQAVLGELKKHKSLALLFENQLKQYISKKQIKKMNSNIIQIPLFKLTPSGIIPSGWSKDIRNRLNRHYNEYDFQFMKIQATDDDPIHSMLFQCKDILKQKFQQLLEKVNFLSFHYIPLGWTQSQLKSCSIWYTLENYHQKFIPRNQLLNFLGDFSKFDKNPALKAARIGQNLSTGYGVVLDKVKTLVYEDQKSGKLLFTDGIGCISPDLVLKIQKQLDSKGNIFQVRYQGSKGMLVINKQLPPNTIVVRNSMKKFQCPNPNACKYLDILQQNYYKPGSLNRQIIILLQANKIPIRNFLQLQAQFILSFLDNKKLFEKYDSGQNFKQKFFQKGDKAFELESIGEMIEQILNINEKKIQNESVLRGLATQRHIQLFEKLIKKSQIRVQKSARLLGIIDQYTILNEGQIYCGILKKDGQKFTVNGRVMLTRNPCMHPADIRVVNCVSKQEATRRFKQKFQYSLGSLNPFDQLTNCIIFPKQGKIPLTAQISGSDLDGDTFFICWDQRLIPNFQREPYIIDLVQPNEREWEGTSYDQIIKFFCEFIFNNDLGKLANCHLAHADKNGADSYQCLKLCRQHSRAVDYPKKGYLFQFNPSQYPLPAWPHFMQKQHKQSYHSVSSLGILYDHAVNEYKNFNTRNKQIKYNNCSVDKLRKLNFSTAAINKTMQIQQQYRNDIIQIMKIYGFDREYQVYNMRVNERNKESRDRCSAIANLQLKYFNLFFEGLGIDQPTVYYELVRGKIIPMDDQVEQKLLLWYIISNSSIRNEYRGLNFMQIVYANQNQTKNRILGLPWFSVPYFTMQLVLKYD